MQPTINSTLGIPFDDFRILSWFNIQLTFLMISGFCHGLIFNLLHKSLNASLTNDTITSLAVHLLELAVTYPQKDFSGKEVAVAVQVIIFFGNKFDE